MAKLFLVSHTHWDREWYQSFEQFRLRLVHLVDRLLDLLESDGDYRTFMLDGQTIVLDDYLEIRPERREALQSFIRSGRLVIGPWHTLPDEFLVSPEALVRNLLLGDRKAREFGVRMPVGYIPDAFGHISQMPQILRGFGLSNAALWRGLDDEPFELCWRGPDGSEVFLLYLRGGYANAAFVPADDPRELAAAIGRLRDRAAPHSTTGCIPLMNGNDHLEPNPALPRTLREAATLLPGDELVHASLPECIGVMRDRLGAAGIAALPVVHGELRGCKVQHLLPNVLSARTWIKQRNAECQTLLEKWAEPWSAWAEIAAQRDGSPAPALAPQAALVGRAWAHLMENHPHDSICGCSIDPVHREMAPRFDACAQVAEGVVDGSLSAMAAGIDTRPPAEVHDAFGAVVVFNPLAGPRTDRTVLAVELPEGVPGLCLVDADGGRVPHREIGRERCVLSDVLLNREQAFQVLRGLACGASEGEPIRGARAERDGDTLSLEVVVGGRAQADARTMGWLRPSVAAWLEDSELSRVALRVRRLERVTIEATVPDVPGFGWRTLWVTPGTVEPDGTTESLGGVAVENEFLRLEASPSDGTLTLTDRRTGRAYAGLNLFVDDGDCGDEYNYCPPRSDRTVREPCLPPGVGVTALDAAGATLEVRMDYAIPDTLTGDRHARTETRVRMPITVRATLPAGVPRCDIEVAVDNAARDHRLRAHFPVPVRVDHAWSEGHWDVLERPMQLPEAGPDWVEQPQPVFPQRAWCDLADERGGLLVGVRGLPEAEVIAGDPLELAVTLLRCVGWLSRDDLTTRVGHAGPPIETPEAQQAGEHRFAYTLVPHSGDWRSAFRQAHAFEAPLRALPAELHGGALPPSESLLRVEPGSLVVSAIKWADSGGRLVVRAWSTDSESRTARIATRWRPRQVVQLNLAEQVQADLTTEDDGSVEVKVKPWEAVTIGFEV